MLFRNRKLLWDYAVARVTLDGIYAEFGVYSGKSINYFAKAIASKGIKIYGFDSFEGLREDWHGEAVPKGSFGLPGRMPRVGSNVLLIKRWFDQSLPRFLEQHMGTFSFVHLDADTYESTATVLNLIADRLQCGTVIVFDEYLGYPGWQNGEFKAWQEFCTSREVKYEYLAFGDLQTAIRIDSIANHSR